MTSPPNHQPPLNGNRLEVSRKLFHLSGIFFLFIPIIFKDRAKVAFLSLACLVSGIEFLRLRSFRITHVLTKIFGRFMRPAEETRLSGSFYYIWGVALSFFFFDRSFALKGLLVLAIADPLASLIGIKFGRHRFFRKTLEGTLMFFLVSTLILYFSKEPLQSAILIGIICALSENIIPFNDNFVLPLIVSISSKLI